MMQILDVNTALANYASSGYWNDAELLIVGMVPNPGSAVYTEGAKGCSEEEYRSHMSLWCLMVAPLLAGNDMRNMTTATKKYFA